MDGSFCTELSSMHTEVYKNQCLQENSSGRVRPGWQRPQRPELWSGEVPAIMTSGRCLGIGALVSFSLR